MDIHKKYLPLFELLTGKNKQVDTVIMTGGRSSGKSYVASAFQVISADNYGWQSIALRFTNTSLKDSVKKAVVSRMNDLGVSGKILNDRVRFENGGEIVYKGINTSSLNQDSNLKSLEDFRLAVTDEASEIPSYEISRDFHLSLRGSLENNIMVLILNPTTKNHWIYQKYFKNLNVKEGSNIIKDNVMYIHTSYLDVDRKFIPKNILQSYERMKIRNPKEYNHIVMGGWLDNSDEQVFSESSLKYYTILPPPERMICKLAFADIADTGTDFHSVPIAYIFDDGSIFLEDVVFTQLPTSSNVILTADILNRHRVNYARIESNFGGSMYIQLLEPHVVATELYSARATSNKHGRILTRQWDIANYVYFRADWEACSVDYANFMKNMFDYTNDGKALHDDAPDSLEGLVSFAKALFGHLY